jgi:pimeloyl-ACP methyl ester carboxylesterase
MTNDTRWNIDPSRVYIAGLSAGAAMATILTATYPDLFAAVGVHSGLEYLAAIEGPAGVAAMKNGGPDPVEQGEAAFQAMGGRAHVMPAIVFHSTADSVVNRVNGDQVVRQWMETNRRASNNTYQPDFTQPTTANEDLVTVTASRTRCPGGMTHRANRSRNTGSSQEWIMPGPAVRRPAPTPTPGDRTPRKACGHSSPTTASPDNRSAHSPTPGEVAPRRGPRVQVACLTHRCCAEPLSSPC